LAVSRQGEANPKGPAVRVETFSLFPPVAPVTKIPGSDPKIPTAHRGREPAEGRDRIMTEEKSLAQLSVFTLVLASVLLGWVEVSLTNFSTSDDGHSPRRVAPGLAIAVHGDAAR
jgi:hypothetical protein